MIVKRDFYLQQLISAQQNGLIKVVTGLRRSGKTYLLFNLFRQHLIDDGVPADHIITSSTRGLWKSNNAADATSFVATSNSEFPPFSLAPIPRIAG